MDNEEMRNVPGEETGPAGNRGRLHALLDSIREAFTTGRKKDDKLTVEHGYREDEEEEQRN